MAEDLFREVRLCDRAPAQSHTLAVTDRPRAVGAFEGCVCDDSRALDIIPAEDRGQKPAVWWLEVKHRTEPQKLPKVDLAGPGSSRSINKPRPHLPGEEGASHPFTKALQLRLRTLRTSRPVDPTL